jgi:hypothetical protein
MTPWRFHNFHRVDRYVFSHLFPQSRRYFSTSPVDRLNSLGKGLAVCVSLGLLIYVSSSYREQKLPENVKDICTKAYEFRTSKRPLLAAQEYDKAVSYLKATGSNPLFVLESLFMSAECYEEAKCHQVAISRYQEIVSLCSVLEKKFPSSGLDLNKNQLVVLKRHAFSLDAMSQIIFSSHHEKPNALVYSKQAISLCNAYFGEQLNEVQQEKDGLKSVLDADLLGNWAGINFNYLLMKYDSKITIEELLLNSSTEIEDEDDQIIAQQGYKLMQLAAKLVSR